MPTALPTKYLNPELMVIGDSLAQGCRSLTVDGDLTGQCYSNIIAREQKWAFRVAQFRRPILGRLEDFVRKASALAIPGFLSAVRKNMKAWQKEFAKPADAADCCFDNIAVAGSEMRDLLNASSETAAKIVDPLVGKDVLDVAKVKDGLGNLHVAINTRYTLNPQGLDEYADWSQFRWVVERKPKRLIAHFGHNDGLYAIGSEGTLVDLVAKMKTAYLDLVDRVLGLPPEVEQIVFLLLPKVSAVANLQPEGADPDEDGYHEAYRPWFSTVPRRLSEKEVKEVDRQVREINGEATDLIHSRGRTGVRIVDTFDVLHRVDYKNTQDPTRQIKIGKLRLDNRYLTGKLIPAGSPSHSAVPKPPKWTFACGGLQSLDGMHPTAIGYAYMACEVMKAWGLPFDPAAIMKRALKAEPLVTDYPSSLGGVIQLMHVYGELSEGLENLQKDLADEDPAACFELLRTML